MKGKNKQTNTLTNDELKSEKSESRVVAPKDLWLCAVENEGEFPDVLIGRIQGLRQLI